MRHQHDERQRRPSRTKWILLAFAAIAGFFLYTEHQGHLYGALPYLLILLCPLMHLFASRPPACGFTSPACRPTRGQQATTSRIPIRCAA